MEKHSKLLAELRRLLSDDPRDTVPLRDLVESLPVGIVYVDADETIRIVNREFERWYAKPRSEIVGRPLREITGDDERYFASQKRVRSALKGNRASFFLPRTHPDGNLRYICAYLQPDITPAGKVLGYVGVFCPVPLLSHEAQYIFDDNGFRRVGENPGE